MEQLLATPLKGLRFKRMPAVKPWKKLNASGRIFCRVKLIWQPWNKKAGLRGCSQAIFPGSVVRTFPALHWELGLSARPYHALIHRELVTLDQVAVLTVEEMEKWTGFGHKSLVELQTVLGQWLAKNLVPAAAAEEELPGEGRFLKPAGAIFRTWPRT